MQQRPYSILKKRNPLLFLGLTVLVILGGCSSTKYLKEDQYLLQNNKIIVDKKGIDKSELQNYTAQKPNRYLLGWPLYVSLYNMVDPDKEAQRDIQRNKKLIEKNNKRKQKGKKLKENPFYLSRWWRNSVGEAPVIFDTYSIKTSKKNMKAYMHNLGYYESELFDTINIHKKKQRLEVKYQIIFHTPFKINTFTRKIHDKRMDSLIRIEPEKYTMDTSALFNAYKLDDMRYEVSQLMQNNGYYGFGPDQVVFYADTNQRSHGVDVDVEFYSASNDTTKGSQGSATMRNATLFPVYYFDTISITNYPYNLELIQSMHPREKRIGKDSIAFNYYDELTFKPYLLQRRIDISSDSLFRQKEVSRSIRGVQGLGIFKSVNFKITPSGKLSPDSLKRYLNCEIQLSPVTKQSYTIDLEGYTSSGTIGTGLKFTYQHKNVLKRAVYFNLSLNGKLERFSSDLNESSSGLLAYEYGVSTTLRFPQFFSPFRLYKFNNRYFPNTLFNINYTFKNRSEYIRQTSSLSFGYSWTTPSRIKHNLNPVDFYLTEFRDIQYDYLVYLINKNLYDQYFDHVIPSGNYSVFYSSQQLNVPKNYFLINLRFELAGNLITMGKKLTDAPKEGSGDLYLKVIEAYAYENVPDSLQQDYIDKARDSMNIYGPSYYTFSGLLYNQYFKSDIDLRYTWFFNKNTSFAARFFGGVIVPYGNTDFSPIEKQYFVGGSNDLRAWWARSIGPGVYILDEQTLQLKNYYQNGDIKLLSNFEFRHNILWRLNGALFADVGNVWNLYEKESFPDGKFDFNTFYKQLALGVGYGLRIDFTFFIIRFDLAFKLHDPSIPSNNKWVYSQGNSYYKNPILNFGIGYPF